MDPINTKKIIKNIEKIQWHMVGAGRALCCSRLIAGFAYRGNFLLAIRTVDFSRDLRVITIKKMLISKSGIINTFSQLKKACLSFPDPAQKILNSR